MIQVLHSRIGPHLDPATCRRIQARLNEADTRQVDNFMFQVDQQRSLLGRLLLAYGLLELGYPVSALADLDYSPQGRPFLSYPLDFNISHSNERVLCAITTAGRVGIDIEHIRSLDMASFQALFSPRFKIELEGSATPWEDFFTWWVARESAIKADGRGMKALSELQGQEGNQSFQLGEEQWQVVPLVVAEGYACALAANTLTPQIEVQELSSADLQELVQMHFS